MNHLVSTIYAADSNWTAECLGGPDGDVATLQGIFCILKNIFKPIPSLIALAALFMIIFSGIRIITAGNDPKALAEAWKSLAWAVIGIILLAGAWFLIVAIRNFTGAENVTEFAPTL